jgi:hypothetical protein
MKKSNGNVSTRIASKSRASKRGRIELGSLSTESTKMKRYNNPTLVLIKDKGQENIQSLDIQREENNDIIAESDPRPIKPDIKSFDNWKQGKNPNKNGPFAANKLETFIRVISAMGMKRITGGYYGYWGKKMYHSSVISKLMSRNDFIQCIKYMMYDSDWVENELNKRWKSHFEASQRLSIDESLIRLIHSFRFQQYNPSKPAKRGIQYFALACSKSGYLISSKMYKGKQSTFPTTPQGIVTYFIESMNDENKNYIYCFDNWFCTYDLTVDLSEKKIPFVATVRSNRPSWLWSRLQKDLSEHGQWKFIVSEDNNHVAMSHRHNSTKPVNFFTNLASEEIELASTSNKTAIPKISYEYKYSMAGVDKSDKLVSNFNVFPYKTFGVLKRNLLTKFAQTLSNSSIIWKMMATNKDLHSLKRDSFWMV